MDTNRHELEGDRRGEAKGEPHGPSRRRGVGEGGGGEYAEVVGGPSCSLADGFVLVLKALLQRRLKLWITDSQASDVQGHGSTDRCVCIRELNDELRNSVPSNVHQPENC